MLPITGMTAVNLHIIALGRGKNATLLERTTLEVRTVCKVKAGVDGMPVYLTHA